ncbi:MAG: hypothetical protein GY940_44865 [bacterium]|nr:hypothetical protein [bacterium]
MTDQAGNSENTTGTDAGTNTTNTINTGNGDRWPELRTLVVGPEKERLDKLEKRLDDPSIHSDETGRILPEAVKKASEKGDFLVKAISPVVEKAVHESVKQNTKTFANLLYPVIRPAIQKAIADTFKKMLQSFNRLIENSFTIRGLRWRFQSMITRKPFAEVVLLHSLMFSVDQVFLIRRDSGLLLHQVQSGLDTSKDGDMVSAMLKAIQDFVTDSFKVDRNEEGLETIQVGDFSIWIAQGEYAILAGVIRGNAPEDIRQLLKKSLQRIEHEFRDEFEAFEGETEPFEKAGYLMTPCLKTEVKQKKKRIPLISWLLLLAAIGYLGFLVWSSIEENRKWSSYLTKVEAIPGVIVTDKGKKGGSFFIKGLRDPLSINPEELVEDTGLEPGSVSSTWDFYHSLAPKYVLARARKILNPPPTVRIDIKDGILYARGTATHQWFEECRILARGIPDIRGIETLDLTNRDAVAFHSSRTFVETQRFSFLVASDQLLPDQEKKLEDFILRVQQLVNLSRLLNKTITITIYGQTDSTGSLEFNQRVGLARARKFFQLLADRGIPRRCLTFKGLNPDRGVSREIDESEALQKRAVTFKVTITPANINPNVNQNGRQ